VKTIRGKYKQGDKVWLHHTQEQGIVIDFVDMFMLKVDLGGLVVPVFIEDLEFYQNQDNKQEVISTTKTVLTEAELYFEKYGQEVATGFYLSFLPIQPAEGAAFFEMILVNDTNDDIQFDIQLLLNNEVYMHLKSKLARRYIYKMGDLAYDELNENPEIIVKIDHRSHPLLKLEKRLKIKPKTFFKDLSSTPILQTSCYNYKLGFLIETAQLTHQPITITTGLTRTMERRIQENFKPPVVRKHEYFYIPDVIDLHIENLIDRHQGMTNAEIITIQLNTFKYSLEDAIVHRLEKLTVIHGIGTGRLRQEIFEILKQIPAVRSFKNEHHYRYGFGATEIFFR
jgi:hypothetical protein